MNASNDDRMRGADDRDAFANVIRDNLSPEAVAAIIALLQTAGNYRNGTPENEAAINQVVWFHDALLDLIGVDGFNELVEEIGL
jgi:hypothetical protein